MVDINYDALTKKMPPIFSSWYSDTYEANLVINNMNQKKYITHIQIPFTKEKEILLCRKYGIEKEEIDQIYSALTKRLDNEVTIRNTIFYNKIQLPILYMNLGGKITDENKVLHYYFLSNPYKKLLGSEYADEKKITLQTLVSIVLALISTADTLHRYDMYLGAFNVDMLGYHEEKGKMKIKIGSLLYAQKGSSVIKEKPYIPPFVSEELKRGEILNEITDFTMIFNFLWNTASGRTYTSSLEKNFNYLPHALPKELNECLIKYFNSPSIDNAKVVSKHLNTLYQEIKNAEKKVISLTAETERRNAYECNTSSDKTQTQIGAKERKQIEEELLDSVLNPHTDDKLKGNSTSSKIEEERKGKPSVSQSSQFPNKEEKTEQTQTSEDSKKVEESKDTSKSEERRKETEEEESTKVPSSKTEEEEESTKVPSSETEEEESTEVPSSKTEEEEESTEVPSSETEEEESTQVPSSETEEEESTKVPSSETEEEESTKVPSSETEEERKETEPTSEKETEEESTTTSNSKAEEERKETDKSSREEKQAEEETSDTETNEEAEPTSEKEAEPERNNESHSNSETEEEEKQNTSSENKNEEDRKEKETSVSSKEKRKGKEEHSIRGKNKIREILKSPRVNLADMKNLDKKMIGSMQIGVFALSKGAGSTYTSITLGEQYARAGYKVAVMSYDGKEDLMYIGSGNADYYCPTIRDRKSTYMEIMRKKYDIIILDFGCPLTILPDGSLVENDFFGYTEEQTELLRCLYKVGLVFPDDWHIEKLAYFEESEEMTDSFLFAIEGLGERADYPSKTLNTCDRSSEVIFKRLCKMQAE